VIEKESLYGKIPLYFEKNHGQIDTKVKYLSRCFSSDIFFTPEGIAMVLNSSEDNNKKQLTKKNKNNKRPTGEDITSSVFKFSFVDANNDIKIAGQDELAGKVNYLKGNFTNFLTDIPTFAAIKYREVYPGIDFVFYGNDQQLEYDIIVKPDGNPNDIKLAIDGPEHLRIDEQGHLVMEENDREVIMKKPKTYQNNDGIEQEIQGEFSINKGNILCLELGEYDKTETLIIDPMLDYSTYLGGSDVDLGFGIAVDSDGSAYVTGETNSTNFPTDSAYQNSYAGEEDAFVTKINTSGELVYSTYLGGSSSDVGRGIAVDSNKNAYITGYTFSFDFPIESAYQNEKAGSADIFVTKFAPTSAGLINNVVEFSCTSTVSDNLEVGEEFEGETIIPSEDLVIAFTSDLKQYENELEIDIDIGGKVCELSCLISKVKGCIDYAISTKCANVITGDVGSAAACCSSTVCVDRIIDFDEEDKLVINVILNDAVIYHCHDKKNIQFSGKFILSCDDCSY